ncbi:MAG: hypothetical protein ABII90_03320 [Bacteroidota bacterium]
MKSIIDLDTIFIFTMLFLSGLESINTVVGIVFGITGTIFAIVKTIDIIRQWKMKKQ